MISNGLTPRRKRRHAPLAALLCAACACAACHTTPEWPPLDLSQPGWTVQRGHAAWKTRAEPPEIVGEILFASHPDGNAFLQLTKIPIPLLSVQIRNHQWQLHHHPQQKRVSGQGPLPPDAIWLHLAAALTGASPAPPLQFRSLQDHQRSIVNTITGETITLYLDPPPAP